MRTFDAFVGFLTGVYWAASVLLSVAFYIGGEMKDSRLLVLAVFLFAAGLEAHRRLYKNLEKSSSRPRRR